MNLLPHKSWNVWGAENVARVRRDQERHRAELEEARKQESFKTATDAYHELRKRKRIDDSDECRNINTSMKKVSQDPGSSVPVSGGKCDVSDSMKHLERLEHINFFLKEQAKAEKEQKKKPAFDAPEAVRRREERVKRLEEKRKEFNDPLCVIKRQLKRKHDYDAHDNKPKVTSGSASIEELRKVRLEREGKERRRVEALLAKKARS